MRKLCDKLGFLKRRESIKCSLEAIVRKVGNAQGDTTNLVTRLQWNGERLYNCTCCCVDGDLVEVGNRLKEAFDPEMGSRQQCGREDVRLAAENTQNLLDGATGAVDRSLGVIVGRALSTGELSKPKIFFVAYCELGSTSRCIQ